MTSPCPISDALLSSCPFRARVDETEAHTSAAEPDMQYHRYHQPAGSVRPQWRCHNNESVASDAAPPRPVARYKTCVLARNQQAVIPAARCGATDVASGFTPRQMSSICSDLSRRTVISFTHLSRLIRLSLSVCGQNYSNC